MSDELVGPSDDKKPWASKTILVNAVLGVLVALVPLIPVLSGISNWINSHGIELGVGWAVLGMGLRLISKGAIVLRD